MNTPTLFTRGYRGTHPLPVLLLTALLGLLGACASAPQTVVSNTPPQTDDLIDGSLFGLAPDDVLDDVDVLGVSPKMRAFLDERLNKDQADSYKVKMILSGLLDEGLQVDYNAFYTLTAEEAFASRQGNCLSFTNLFIALARESGVRVKFQEVEVPPTWGFRDDVYLYNLHINAWMDLPTGEQVVDFNIEDYKSDYRTRRLTDREAIARYYNNMGVHYLQTQDYAKSFQYLQKALALRSHTAHFWTNLGTLYRRAGYEQYAEAAYLKAEAVGEEPTALSNLARLYKRQGRDELAKAYENKVDLFRRRNPYYLFHLAEEAYAANQYDAALDLVRSAIRKSEENEDFHRLMGQTLLQLDDQESAAESFRRAAELASTTEEREAYNAKLKLLADSSN